MLLITSIASNTNILTYTPTHIHIHTYYIKSRHITSHQISTDLKLLDIYVHLMTRTSQFILLSHDRLYQNKIQNMTYKNRGL